MTVLLLRLAGPLQAWGDSSRFQRRATASVPTKSGVLGLLAAADGRRRTDEIEDLLALRFGVRVDQPGTVITDFHTAHPDGYDKHAIITRREYLSDAVFVAAVEGPEQLITGLHERIRRPRFPLFLGRRSCPVDGDLDLGLHACDVDSVLDGWQWTVSERYARRHPTIVHLRAQVDGTEGNPVRDVPVSFSPSDRRYGWRTVVERDVVVENPWGRDDARGNVDWFAGW